MKRLFSVILSLCLVAGLVAVAGAEDRLTINGDYYLRAIYVDNPTFNAAREPGAAGEAVEYFHQRLRTNMLMAVSDDMTVQLRADWAENAWGENGSTGPNVISADTSGDSNLNSVSALSVLQIEYANVKINKELWSLSVGLDSSFDYGLGDVYRPHGYGFKLRLKLPVVIALDLTKWNEGGSRVDSSPYDDTNYYSLQVASKVAGFAIGGYYANIHNLEQETMKQAVEVFGRGKLGPVSLATGIAYIFGEQSPTVEYAGTISAIVDAGVDITPIVKVGGHLYYTSPNDDLTKANDGALYVWGPAAGFISNGMPGLTWDGIGYEMGFQNRSVIGGNAGQIGADIYANFRVAPFTIGAQVAYFMPADDEMNTLDSRLGIGAGVSYNWKPNVILALGAIYVDNSWDSSVTPQPDDPFGVQANFWVLF